MSIYQLLVVSLAFLGSILALNSPCPDLFHYDSTDEPNQWSGTVTLLSDDDLQGVWTRLIFDEKLTELELHDNFEVVRADNHREYLIKNRDFVLKAATPVDVKITVKYEGDKIPTLIGYRLNAKMVCPSSNVNSEEFFSGDLNNKDFLSSITSSSEVSAYACGTTPPSANHERANKKAQNGQWPWQGAIYIRNNSVEKYVCEAILISNRHVLTPGHCVTYLKSEFVVPARLLRVYLGKYSLDNDGENKEIQGFEVERIHLYPGYRSKGLLNDLAVIRLDKPVIISDYVRPVCLSPKGEKRDGILIGYEIKGERFLKFDQANVEVLNEEECIKKNSFLKGFYTDNTLCTSYAENDSVCVGDSGSSLVYLSGGPKPVWELKGVVNVGVGLQNKYVCNRASTILLVDVANYLKWIQEVVS
ncbi:chymotrypsin-like elastase family member 2A [Tribolium madens]|uniref:chymotrypsin-like elastase family member 2A n=1 Tax=Tribolium madens TaxID=41895 RepID=UPI001CF73B10|nr:chymotrypsin-like elastase family member 2A [Tribolium madens]